MRPSGRALVDEGCEDARSITTARQAAGILRIHKDCDPPCPRKNAAVQFLQDAGDEPGPR